ncbi:hypothetical protein GIB67_025021, partial [Kingdonia uniflora]
MFSLICLIDYIFTNLKEVAYDISPDSVVEISSLFRGKHYLVKSDHDLLEMWKYSSVERVGDVHFYVVNKGLAQELGIVDSLDEGIVVPSIYMDIDVNN